MKKFISPKFIIAYLILYGTFRFLFGAIECYYIKDMKVCPYPIDMRVAKTWKLFDASYVQSAKSSGYDTGHYYESFFIADLVFPLIYTFLFLSILQLVRKYKVYSFLKVIVIIGAVADYLEDLCFALYLQVNGEALSHAVAFFTTIKTFLFIFNNVAAIGCLVAAGILFLRRRNTNAR